MGVRNEAHLRSKVREKGLFRQRGFCAWPRGCAAISAWHAWKFAPALQCFRATPMPIDRDREEILRIAAPHGARNVRVFGSVARGDDRADSDVDLLVEMEDDRSLLDLVGLEQDLEELLRRQVRPHRRQHPSRPTATDLR